MASSDDLFPVAWRLLAAGRSLSGGADDPDTTPDPEPDPPAAPAAPDPAQFVSRTEFDAIRAQLEQTNGLLAASMQRPAPAPSQPQGLAAPTDEEIEQAIREGTGAAALLKRRDDALRREMRGELETIRAQGTELFASTAERWAERELPHFKRFKAEIKKELERIPAQYRTSAEAYESVHDMVVGRNHKTLLEEARQQAIREGIPAGGIAPGGAHGRGKDAAPKVPTPTEKFGEVAGQMLQGVDPDVFARKMGYTSWAAYVKDADEYEVGEIPVAGRRQEAK